MEDLGLFVILGWGSPIGLGLFIVLVSFAAWLNIKKKDKKD